ncbi:MAG: radical SAM protein [Candidatus Omnitrophica bacterium]|nr:radical SAM protein [Candidatus Omnitrophota bacterium]
MNKRTFGYAGVFWDNMLSFHLKHTPNFLPILHLDVTERCNLKCRMCNLWKKPGNTEKNELTAAEIGRIVKEVKKSGCLIISIGGGEPVIRDDIFDIIESISASGIAAHMDTNGTLLNECNVSLLKKTGLKVLSVSLDSHIPQVHNAIRGADCFTSVIEGIKTVKRAAPAIKIIINCVINKKNVQDLKKIYQLCLDLEVDGIKFAPVLNSGKQHDLSLHEIKDLFFEPRDMEIINSNIKEVIKFDSKRHLLLNSSAYLKGTADIYAKNRIKQRCFAGITTCVIMPYGDLAPCYNLYNSGLVAGNLREKSFAELWGCAKFKEIRKRSKRCQAVCWDLCTKEPSLRFDTGVLLNNAHLVFNELNLF